MKTLLSLIILILISIAASAQPAADYYVDGVNGNNMNAGTSSGLPFLTLGAAQAVIGANQTLAIYGGASALTPIKYREQFTAPASDITVIGWGLAKPDINCSDAVPPANWTATGGYTNVWQTTVTTDNILGFLRAWEDDRAMFRAISLANLDATAGRYFTSGNPAGNGGVTFTLYIHPLANDNPTTSGKVYEFNKRAYGVLSGPTTPMNVSFVRTRRNLCNNGSIEVGTGSFVSDIQADDGHKHNALAHQGSTWEDVVMTDSYYAGQNRIAMVLNDNVGDATSTTTFRRITYNETVETNGTGFLAHVNVSGKFGPVILEDCVTTGMVYTAVSSIASTDLTIQGGTFVGNVVLASDNNLLSYATLSPTTGYPGQVQIPYSTNVEIDHVTITGNASTGPGLVRITYNPNLSIHDCTFTSVIQYDGALYFNNTSNVASFSLLNNVFNAPTQLSHLNGPGTANLPAGSIIDGNIYHYPTPGASWIQKGGVTRNIAILAQWTAWQALGYDVNGSRATP